MVEEQEASSLDISVAGKGDLWLMYTIIIKAIK